MNSQQYLSVTAITLAAACAPSVQEAKAVKSVATVSRPKPLQSDCSNLDLTQKVGFSTVFEIEEKTFRYRINQKEKYYYDELYQCDKLQRPLPDHFMVMREFSGPKKDAMQINAVLAVHGEQMDYIPFWRDPSGTYSSVPGQSLPQPELEDMFSKGRLMLDHAKNLPGVCEKLLNYKPVIPNLAKSSESSAF